jgi:hypothetical protein
LRDLGTHRLPWRDLLVIVKQSPPGSALSRAMLGPDHVWNNLTDQLLARISDALEVANWQRAEGKRSEYPKPIPRPGVEQPRHHGAQAVSMEDARQRLEQRRHLAVVTDDN